MLNLKSRLLETLAFGFTSHLEHHMHYLLLVIESHLPFSLYCPKQNCCLA